MLTLPLQGVSASVMVVPMADGGAGQSATVMSKSGLVQTVDCAREHQANNLGSATSHPPSGGSMPTKAKVCDSSCCTGVMLGALAMPAFGAIPDGKDYGPRPYNEPAGFIPDALERPPRVIS